MFHTIQVNGVTVLEKRSTGVVCVVRGRTLEIPLEALWDEGAELVVGAVCDIEVWDRWARSNGIDRE